MRLPKNSRAVMALAIAAASTGSTYATEGGGSIYRPGTENFTCCALPPPGDYLLGYFESYRASKLRDNNGSDVTPPGFSVRANGLAVRYVHVFQTPIFGASAAVEAIVPLVDLNVRVPGASQTRKGVGDVAVGAGLGWHHSRYLHTAAAVDLYLPTGQYSTVDLANIGRNYIAVQPIVGVSYIDPTGFNGDAKVVYNLNMRNKDTDYRSGQELIVDYAAGWGVGSGLVLGVGGYLYQQTTDDRLHGGVVAGAKGRAIAIGPSVRYDTGKGSFITLKYQTESGVHNRPEGKALWLKAVLPI